MLKTHFYFFVLVLFCSCESMILGDEPADTPVATFETYWQDLDEHYSLFGVRNRNWDSIYAAYRPLITAQTTQEELWMLLKEMATHLDDSHVTLLRPNADFEESRDYFESGSEDVPEAMDNFDLQLILDDYLESTIADTQNDAPIYHYGKLKDRSIGYIHLSAFDSEHTDLMDEILSTLGNYSGLVLDLRNNTGGAVPVAQAMAGRFADKETLVYTVEEKNGPNHNDFGEKIQYHTRVIGAQSYQRPVVLLTDRMTVSAAEVFLLHMKAFEHITQIGDTTAGDFSEASMRRFLPNGWQYEYSVFKFLLPSGKSLDGIGHAPDIYIKNDKDILSSGTDQALESAINFLSE